MGIESRLSIPRREGAIKAALVTAAVAVPIVGFVAREQKASRKIKKEKQAQEDSIRQEAVLISRDSVNSGNSGFDFD